MRPTETFLEPAEYVDSAAPGIVAFARRICEGASDDVTRAVRLYYAIRDGIVYTPYCDFKSPETFRASSCLARGSGFCVAKAALLAAAARASGIRARRHTYRRRFYRCKTACRGEGTRTR